MTRKMVERETSWLMPSSSDKLVYPLRSSDLGFIWVPNVPMCYLFPAEANINPDILRDGLKQTLDQYPIMAGRLKTMTNENGKTCLVSDLSDSQGILFQTFTSTLPAPETKGNSGSTCWEPFYVDGLDKTAVREHGKKEPFFRAKYTKLEGGASVLCVSFVHSISDGDSIVKFMNTWSYYCGVLAGVTPTPEVKPSEPDLDRRLPEDIEYDYQDASGKENKLTITETVSALAEMLPGRLLDSITDYTLDTADIEKLKKQAKNNLPRGEWVSSYEIIMAMLLKVLSVVDNDVVDEDYIARFLVNSRGRGKLSSPNYFGNALAYPEVNIPAEKLDSDNWLADMALAIHKNLRAALRNGKELDRVHVDYEKGVESHGAIGNFLKTVQWVKPWALNNLYKSSICNSWVGYNWLDLDFGSQVKPEKMMVPKSFSWKRHMFVHPRTTEQYVVRIHLSADDSMKYEKAIKELNLPLKRLDSSKPFAGLKLPKFR